MMESKSETIVRAASTPYGAIAQEQTTKSLANLIAGFAVSGFAVNQLTDGGFLVCRWGLSKHCPDLRSLSAFAHQVGARV